MSVPTQDDQKGFPAITGRIQQILLDIREAALSASRKPEEISLLPVTTHVSVDLIRQAYQAGCREFGENRVQELREKWDELPSDVRWHLIGGLQTNKVKYIVGRVALVHSLDRIDLAAEIDRQAQKKGVAGVPCLIQINSTGEAQKGGVAADTAAGFINKIEAFKRIKIRGLMTIGPLSGDANEIRRCFRLVRMLRVELSSRFPDHDWSVLSMGMSGDYRMAIEEGSTLIRIGTSIFGKRPPAQRMA